MELFSPLIGNEPIQRYLQKAFEREQIPKTLLFCGPSGVGKSLFAKTLGRALLCNRSSAQDSVDLHCFEPEGKSGLYSIETIRKIITEDRAPPFESSCKVLILQHAHRMLATAANALLKTLEEPSSHSYFFLISEEPQDMLPTLLSRCITLRFDPIAEELLQKALKEQGLAPSYAKIAQGSFEKALSFARQTSFQQAKEQLFSLLKTPKTSLVRFVLLDSLEAFVEEGKKKSPLEASQRAESLWVHALMWYRDQIAQKQGVSQEFLFFPQEPLVLLDSRPLFQVDQAVSLAREAFHKNLKLSICFTPILSLV